MNLKNTRLDDRLNGAAFVVIVAIVLSICSAMVGLELDTDAPVTAQASAAAQVVAVSSVAAVR